MANDQTTRRGPAACTGRPSGLGHWYSSHNAGDDRTAGRLLPGRGVETRRQGPRTAAHGRVGPSWPDRRYSCVAGGSRRISGYPSPEQDSPPRPAHHRIERANESVTHLTHLRVLERVQPRPGPHASVDRRRGTPRSRGPARHARREQPLHCVRRVVWTLPARYSRRSTAWWCAYGRNGGVRPWTSCSQRGAWIRRARPGAAVAACAAGSMSPWARWLTAWWARLRPAAGHQARQPHVGSRMVRSPRRGRTPTAPQRRPPPGPRLRPHRRHRGRHSARPDRARRGRKDSQHRDRTPHHPPHSRRPGFRPLSRHPCGGDTDAAGRSRTIRALTEVHTRRAARLLRQKAGQRA